jgi:hypothetical protein
MARKDFEGTSAAECRPLGRRLKELSIHAERIKWPASIVTDLRDAAKVMEIIAEDAEVEERGF